jgi:hypothetical protein
MKKKRWLNSLVSCFGIIDCNSPDMPGGSISGGGGDSAIGANDSGAAGDVQTSTTGGDNPDNNQADPPQNAADNGNPPVVTSPVVPDFDSKFADLDGKINNLLDAIKNTNSGNDSGSGLSLEHDDLVTMLAEDPSGFIGKITSIVERSVTERVAAENATNTYNGKIENTINAYADANPDFEKMWDSGTIKSFMDKNPGHNALSAHMTITMNNRVEQAKKEGAEEAVRNFRAKTGNQVLNGGPGISPEQRDAALKDTSKFGGRAAVLAARAGIH